MNAKKIQEEINRLNYCDARLKDLICKHFADEVKLIYEDSDGDVYYKFMGCYKVNFNHCLSYKKNTPSKELSIGQIPYFIQSVVVEESIENDELYYICRMNIFPLDVEIWCKDIDVGIVDTNLG